MIPSMLSRVNKDLRKFDKERVDRFESKLAELSKPLHPIGYKHLANADGYFRLVCGDDRVIYRVDNGVPVIVMVGHRRDVYARFGRWV